MVRIGTKVSFDPYRTLTGFGKEMVRGIKVTGTVVMINEDHKWFSVEYGNPKQRTSFKFCEIGSVVNVCGI